VAVSRCKIFAFPEGRLKSSRIFGKTCPPAIQRQPVRFRTWCRSWAPLGAAPSMSRSRDFVGPKSGGRNRSGFRPVQRSGENSASRMWQRAPNRPGQPGDVSG
jgi:hypothetical protein